MRIIGEIAHPTLKITAFKHDGKLSVKFEVGLMEQLFKFRESEQLKEFPDLERLVDAKFIEDVLAHFKLMHQSRERAMEGFFQQLEEDDFPVIV